MSKSNENPDDIHNSSENNKPNQEKKNNLLAFAGPEQIVYEGSKVFLEGHSSQPNQKLIWKQTGGPKVDLKYEGKEDENSKIKNPYFKAPYIAIDFGNRSSSSSVITDNNNKIKPFAKLTFELTAQDQTKTISSPPSTVNIIVKMVQRALVLQGGGSLGAYEAGVFQALCDYFIEKNRESKVKRNRPLFDVIAGSSIGAVNAAIIVGSIKKRIEDKDKNNSYSSSSSSTTINTSSTATEKQESAASIWKDTANDLDRFWNEISTST